MLRRLFKFQSILWFLWIVTQGAGAQPALPTLSPEKKVEAVLRVVEARSLNSASEPVLLAGAADSLRGTFGRLPQPGNRQDLVQTLSSLSRRHQPEQVERAAVSGILAATDDRYSKYLTRSEYFASIKGAGSSRWGVGILMTPDDGALTVIEVAAQSPAMEAGIARGDRLIAIEGQPAQGMSVAQARALINAPGAGPVNLELERAGAGRKLSVARRNLAPAAVTGRHLEQPGSRLGYLKIPSFQRDTAGQLDQKISELGTVDGLVLDLRNNPGGEVGAAVEVCSRFFSEGKTVVIAHHREGRRRVYQTGPAARTNAPLVVLVNRHSASAAEITAAALRSHAGALVVGERTYGKGTIQDFVRLPDLSVLKLTVAKYETAGGEMLEGRGVTPDLRVAWPVPASQDLQLDAALQTLRGLASRAGGLN